eukprot:CAMPEP_0118945732 /NCGR_PEP_ID=MMETSP1169-20130426/42829_1 /TAXON_ID=36882 /ORGANISM="Pyramimonas obovata, Strain CCMP722" /LENGTH=315 /DNA_ID=CAMNT_0006891511 /DNA_START=300 /DNA_END=1244 /DNA_ORIENTATION=+
MTATGKRSRERQEVESFLHRAENARVSIPEERPASPQLSETDQFPSSSDDESVPEDEGVERRQSWMEESPFEVRQVGFLGKALALLNSLREDVEVVNDKENKVAWRIRSLNFFEPDNIFRLVCVFIIQRRVYPRLITSIVVLNCFFMAARQPTEPDSSLPNRIAEYAELVFTIAFTLELMLNMVANGLIMHRGSYLRSGWNVVDFCIVLLSWLAYLPGAATIMGLRTIRLLKPLRTISANPSMRQLATALVKCIPMLITTANLLFVTVVLFAVVAMQVWMSKFHYYCTNDVTGERVEDEYLGPAPQLCGGPRSCP